MFAPQVTRLPPSCRRTAGFVLIEGLVGLLIVSVGVIAALRLQTAMLRNATNAATYAEASNLAQAKIEQLRLLITASEHHAASGSNCGASGTLVQPGADTIQGLNAAFQRSWTVEPVVTSCPPVHRVTVSVGWSDGVTGNNSVNLRTLVAWIDPKRSTPTLAGGSNGAGFVNPTGNAHLGDDTIKYTALPPGAVANAGDGTYIYQNPDTKEYELLIPKTGGYAVGIYSTVPYVLLSGLVALDTAPYATSLTLADLVLYRSDVTYCLFPLAFSNQNDPGTYGLGNGTRSGTNDKAGAYRCYVPQGWQGDIGLYQRSTNCLNQYKLLDGDTKKGQCNYDKAMACPGGPSGTLFRSGLRYHYVLITSADGDTIVGQSGLMPPHQYMLVPDNPGYTRLSRLDFLVYKPGNNDKNGCADRITATTPNPVTSGTTASGASYQLNILQGALVTEPTGRIGIPSLRHSDYPVDSYRYGQGGFLTVSGSITGTCNSIRAIGSTGFSTFLCPVTNQQFTCQVSYGWQGSIGGVTIPAVTSNLTGVAAICPP